MQPIIMSRAIANATASQLEFNANNIGVDNPTIAYQLRLLMTMLRECPDKHAIVIEANFSATDEE